MFTELRKRLSGLATPMYVIDAPDGSGKVSVALDFWQCKFDSHTDFNDKKLKIVKVKK